jgi:hypothetical protein
MAASPSTTWNLTSLACSSKSGQCRREPLENNACDKDNDRCQLTEYGFLYECGVTNALIEGYFLKTATRLGPASSLPMTGTVVIFEQACPLCSLQMERRERASLVK